MATDVLASGASPGIAAQGSPVEPPVLRTWALDVITLGLVVLIAWRLLGEDPQLSTRVPWWSLAIAFYAVEWLAVDLRRRFSHDTLSMISVPLVVGLFTLAPMSMLAAQAVGAVGYASSRRQPTRFRVFFVTWRLLQVAVALLVFSVMPGSFGQLGPLSWFGSVTAALAAYVVGSALAHVLALFSGLRPSVAESGELFAYGSVVTMANTGLGVLIVYTLFVDARMLSFTVLPFFVLFAAYRSHRSSREERARWKTLYDLARKLREAPEVDTALSVAAHQAQKLFQAQFCEIVITIGAKPDAYRLISGPGLGDGVMEPEDFDRWSALSNEAKRQEGPYLVGSAGRLASHFGDRQLPIRSAMITTLEMGDGPAGLMIVANPLDAHAFDAADLDLLGTLAGQVCVTIRQGHLEHSLALLTQVKEELQHRAHHDELTGLANRAFFRERVWRALRETRRTDGRMAVMFIDIDDFKVINDSIGHLAGDKVLRTIARRLREHCDPDATIARLGGDEFGVLSKNLDGTQDAEQAARRILASIGAPMRVEGEDVTVHASIGIAFGKYGVSASEVLENADVAMYAAKNRGTDCIQVFETKLHSDVRTHFRLRHQLDVAVPDEEFRLAFQPMVDLHQGRLVGFEALLRWSHPGRGLLMPNAFLKLAEDSGRIHEIGRWVMWEALRRAEEWRRILGRDSDFSIAVNISASELDEADLVEEVGAALAARGVLPRTLTLEITESTLMEAAAERLDELRQLGVRLAIDDFGTGYSSLASLYQMPVDILKIDRLFVDGLGSNDPSEEDAGPFVNTIVGLGRVLGLEIIAEGIETRAQLSRLRDIGCELGQGFYFDKPLTARQATRLVEARVAGHTFFDSERDAPLPHATPLRAVHRS